MGLGWGSPVVQFNVLFWSSKGVHAFVCHKADDGKEQTGRSRYNEQHDAVQLGRGFTGFDVLCSEAVEVEPGQDDDADGDTQDGVDNVEHDELSGESAEEVRDRRGRVGNMHVDGTYSGNSSSVVQVTKDVKRDENAGS